MIDLHIHTKYSDGEDDEFSIVDKIVECGIKEFAICDHDTIEGSKKVFDILKKDKKNLKFHSGVELSCRVNEIYGGINVHLLVRDFGYDEINIAKIVEEMAYLRKVKIKRMVDYVELVYGIHIVDDEINEKLQQTNSFGKPHLYSILQKYGQFDRKEYYSKMRKLDCDDLKLDAIKVINETHKGCGNIMLAHPKEIMEEYDLSYNDIDKIVEYLVNYGLDGIETMHSKHYIEDYREFSKIAKKYNLKESQGSDYHGFNVKPTVKLGVCIKK